MKSKFTRIMGVGLTIALLTSLIMVATPVSAGTNVWSKQSIPQAGSTYKWVLAPNTTPTSYVGGPIARGADGKLYAYANTTTTTTSKLFKSADDGHTWADVGAQTSAIVDIAPSPTEASVIFIATATELRKSIDAGVTFSSVLSVTGETIKSIDVAKSGTGYYAVIGTSSKVYLYNEAGYPTALTDMGAGTIDVLAVAFSPKFATDLTIVAVGLSDATVVIKNKVGGGAWNGTIAAPGALTVAATDTASIAFSSDFATTAGLANFYVGINGTTGQGVYLVQGMAAPGPSILSSLSTTAVTSLEVSGSAVTATAKILGGKTDGGVIYSSTSGTSWSTIYKPPTGTTNARVLMASDFATSGKAWVATSGIGGAVSITKDSAITWNQAGLINAVISTINDLAFVGTSIYMATDTSTTVTTAATAAVAGDAFTITAASTGADTVVVSANETAVNIAITVNAGSVSSAITTNNSSVAVVASSTLIVLGPLDKVTISAASAGANIALVATAPGGGSIAGVTAAIGNDTDGDARVVGVTPAWNVSLPDATANVATVTVTSGTVSVTMSGTGTAVLAAGVYTITFKALSETALVASGGSANVTYAVTTGTQTATLTTDADADVTLGGVALAVAGTVTPGSVLLLPDAAVAAVAASTATTTYDSIWRFDGTYWERIFHGTGATAVDRVAVITTTVFLTNIGGTAIYRSIDGGQIFVPQNTLNQPAAITAWLPVDANTIYTGAASGYIYKTVNNGLTWTSIQLLVSGYAIAGTVENIVANPKVPTMMAAGTAAGYLFYTLDSGVIWSILAAPSATAWSAGSIIPAFNPANPAKIYAAATNGGIYRLDGSTWVRIDAVGTGSATVYGVNGIVFAADGTLYATDFDTVGAGIGRSINPDDSVLATATVNPYFELVNAYSTTTLAVALSKLWLATNLYAISGTSVYVYTDTLAAQIGGTRGTGLTAGGAAGYAALSWPAVTGATQYGYEVNSRSDFDASTAIASGTATLTSQTVASALITSGGTYYWRVRVSAPVRSKWSVTKSFSTTIGAPNLSADYGAPGPGATDVSVEPVFTWGAVSGATGYEFVIAEDSTFTIIDYAATTTQNYHGAREKLAYDTTYYWRVRAVSATSSGAWAYGVFTTMAKPVAVEKPEPEKVIITQPGETKVQIIEVPTPTIVEQPIPSYLLWTIIGIGGVLVIALIVLIVRTRRVA